MATSSATTTTTSSVYLHVIADVISKMHGEFVDNGGHGEDVLTDLQGLWEAKMMQAGVILGPADRPAVTKLPLAGAAPVHDLNVPYEGEEYETPTADMLFPPTPLQTPMPTPLPGTVDSSVYNIPTGSSDYPTPRPESVGNSGENAENKTGRSSPYMDFFLPPSGKRKREDLPPQYQNGGYIPQQDGAADAVLQVKDKIHLPSINDQGNWKKLANAQKSLSNRRIPQLDGQTPDPYDNMLSTPNIYNYQGVVSEDYNIASTPMHNELQAGTPAHLGNNDDVEDDDDDEPLNENDDDDLDDVDEEEEVNTQQLVLAQFDKVTRTKSRWKCTLKDGIMHINDKDILFNKATGEFEF